MATTNPNPWNDKLKDMMNRMANYLSDQIDTLLNRNGQESPLIRKIKETLAQTKDCYQALPKPRKVHLNFLLKVAVLFLSVAVFYSFKLAYTAIGIYAGFIFLDKIPFLSLIISFISDFVVLITGFIMPDRMKDIMSFGIKYLLQFGLTLFIGTTIAPFYLAYRGFLLFRPAGVASLT